MRVLGLFLTITFLLFGAPAVTQAVAPGGVGGGILTTTCQACSIEGILVIYSQCISSPGSGKSGCYTLEQTPGCGFTNNYCVDVFGGGGVSDTSMVDRIDSFEDIGSADTNQLILRLMN